MIAATKTLHLGCGRKKVPGALGVDIVGAEGVDLIWDLNRIPWPLPDDTFEIVYMIDVLEHIDNVIVTMEQVHRVCRDGAAVTIQSPFASSDFLWTDPTHKRGFTSRSFKFFDEGFCAQHFEYSKARFQVIEVAYLCGSRKWFDRVILRFANRHKYLYEKRFMYVFPVENIRFRLRAIKGGPRAPR